MVCGYLYISGAPEGSTDSGSGESEYRTCDQWFTRHSAYLLHHGGKAFKTWAGIGCSLIIGVNSIVLTVFISPRNICLGVHNLLGV